MSEKTTAEQMLDLVAEYKNLQEAIDTSTSSNPMVYPELLRIRKQLSILGLEYAVVVGEWAMDFKESEAQRKYQYYIKKRECISSGLKIGAEMRSELKENRCKM